MKNEMFICALALAPTLSGGELTDISKAANLGSVYQAVLNQVKKDGFEIESASMDAGLKTVAVVTGRYKQTGAYLKITFISDGGSETTARIAVYEEKRFKGLQTEPWSTPRVNEKRSRDEAAILKRELGW